MDDLNKDLQEANQALQRVIKCQNDPDNKHITEHYDCIEDIDWAIRFLQQVRARLE